MKHIKSFKNNSSYNSLYNKLEIFFKDIKMKQHNIITYYDFEAIQIYNIENGNGLFNVEGEFMYYENDGDKYYPLLDKYIASKVKGSDLNFINIKLYTNDVSFDKKEYDLFKSTNKYNL